MIEKRIASETNAVYKTLLDCLQPRGVKKHGLFIVSGEKAVRDLLERYPDRVRDLIICTDRGFNAATLQTSKLAPTTTVIDFAKPLFDALDLFGTRFPLLALNAWEIEDFDATKPPRGLEILCATQDPSNLGACLRSAAAFGASKLILLKESASPFHPKASRAASASTFATPLFRGPSIADLAADSESGHVIYALDLNGESLPKFKWPKDARLLVGEEGRGVPDLGLNLKRISIPISTEIESLNASVALSIALYTYRAQQN